MQPSLYMVEGRTDEAGGIKVFRLHTITPRGRDVRCELAIDPDPGMVMTRGDRDWRMGAVEFRSIGSDSDGFASNLAQIAKRKTPADAKLPERVVFAATEASGSFEAIGEERVDLFLWFKIPFGFTATLRVTPYEVWLAIGDDDEEAAINCFAGQG